MIKKLIFPICAFALWIISGFLSNYPKLVEEFYSTSVNKIFIQLVSRMTGVLPFSLGEIIFIFHIFLLLFYIILIIRKRDFKNGLVNMLAYISTIYIVFMLVWGFNYSRLSVGDMLGLEVEAREYQVLRDLVEELTQEANYLRGQVEEDENNIFKIGKANSWIYEEAQVAFDILGEKIPQLRGNYGRPKSILLSKPMLYTGISGVYFPFTGEANVNTATRDLLFPATVLHEIAHQRGIASEDEANFIAYLSGIAHPDPIFKYSSTVLALIHSQNALYRIDPKASLEIRETYSEGLKRDLRDHREFWSKYRGRTKRVSDRVNDIYLRGNRQEEGVQSYGNVVDWLLAYREINKEEGR